MRKIALAILFSLGFTFAITISPSEAALAHRLDTPTNTVRQSTITVDSTDVDQDDLSNQPLDSDDNHDNG